MPAKVRPNFIFGCTEIVFSGRIPRDWQYKIWQAGFKWLHGCYAKKGLDATTKQEADKLAREFNNRKTLYD